MKIRLQAMDNLCLADRPPSTDRTQVCKPIFSHWFFGGSPPSAPCSGKAVLLPLPDVAPKACRQFSMNPQIRFNMKNFLLLFSLMWLALPVFSQNHALDFDGVDDYLDFGNAYPSGSVGTHESWVRPHTGNFDERIFGNGGIPALRIGSSRKLDIWNHTSGTCCWVSASTSSLPLNTWTHIAVVRTSSTTVEVYVNGVNEVGPITLNSNPPYTSGLTFGRQSSGGFGNYYNGEADEIRIWDDARTATEVSDNMNTELTGTEEGLVSYYKFDDDTSACNVIDCSSNENHGTRHGTSGANNLPQSSANIPSLTDVACGATNPNPGGSTCVYIGPDSGDWDNPCHWDCGKVPGPDDHAIINGTDGVLLSGSHTVESLTLGQLGSNLTATLFGGGTITITSTLNGDEGHIRSNCIIESTATMYVRDLKIYSPFFNMKGTTIVHEADFHIIGKQPGTNTFYNNGTINITGCMNNSDGMNLGDFATFINNGTLDFDTSCHNMSGNIALNTFINDGAIQADSLSITGGIDFIINQSGTVTGNIRFDLCCGGTVTHNGINSPGMSPGTWDFNATPFVNNGTIEMELQNLDGPSIGHDYIVTNPASPLSGTLEVLLINGFTPYFGDAFTIISCPGGCNGEFDQIAFPDDPTLWEIQCNAEDITIVYTDKSNSNWFEDSDEDGYGNTSVHVNACASPAGFVDNETDCDDNDANVYPGNAETTCNGVDDDCDANTPDMPDNDGDGSTTCDDCNDNDPLIYPGATEICNGVDDDCDNNVDEGVQSIFYADSDGDGFGDPDNSTMACSAPNGHVSDNNDCDDADANVNPAATEVCDGVDNDCDFAIDEGVQSIFYADSDGDGFGDPDNSTMACSAPNGHVSDNNDCDDADANVNPAATEVCDGVDNDCDFAIDEGVQSIFYADSDSDGFGDPDNSTMACSAPNGHVSDNNDCDDADANVNPAATEVCDGVDNDCDFAIDEGVQSIFYADSDGDGFGDPDNSTMACSAPNGHVSDNNDCDDADANVNPAATEVCDDIDNNCDNQIDEGCGSNTYYADTDGDGYGDPNNSTTANSPPNGYVSDNTDCDDTDADINPAATEVCNGTDDNCNGQVDENLSGLTYDDNVTFSSQADVDAWLSCYTIIDGHLTIKNSVSDLGPLIGLEEVTGHLKIKSTDLTDLTGLDSLKTIGGKLQIHKNNDMTSLTGLEKLEYVDKNLQMFRNFDLGDCCSIHDLLDNGGVDGSVLIFQNYSGCNSESDIQSSCGGSNLVGQPGRGQQAIQQIGMEKTIALYPNPAMDVVQLNIGGHFRSGIVRVFDTAGKLVLEKMLMENAARERISLDRIKPGLCFVQVVLDGDVFVRKLAVQ